MKEAESRAPATVRVRTLAIAVLALLGLAAAGGWLFVYLGLYNIAATVQHTAPVYHLLEYAMLRSVEVRARNDAAPPDLMSAQRVTQGAVLYRGHCVQCHGAPGVPPDPFAAGLTPAPVNLVPTARHWDASEIFWTIKHGIKMTGMPAWKYRMSDESMWDLTAFVKAMAVMSPLEYAQLVRTLPQHRHGESLAAAGPEIRAPAFPDRVQLGSVLQGRQKTQAFLCATCHQIPGIVGANRQVGPPLAGVGGRTFIAGVIANRPENMIRFLLDPQAVDPRTAMPALGLTPEDARDIAAYLYTLRTP